MFRALGGAGAAVLSGQAAVLAIFDAAYYLRRYPDIAEAGADPLAHFLSIGWAEGRNPCALFDTELYFERNPDVALVGMNPLVHYARFGAREGRVASVLFDVDWYLANNPDVAASGVNPLAHYLTQGWREGRQANPLFDQDWYAKRYPRATIMNAPCPLAHYAEHGLRQRLSPHPLFDGAYYLQRHPDVEEAGMNPLAHYLLRGHLEPRQPHPEFDVERYLREHPDVERTGANPLVHYVCAQGPTGADMQPPHPRPRRSATDAPSDRANKSKAATFLDPTVGKTPREIIDMIRAIATEPASPPLVTVIVPAYQQLRYTLRCLLSILQSSDGTPFEILLVDDQSPDGSGGFLASELEGVPKVRVLINSANVGFLRSCNAAAASVQTEFLFFLNNDTAVMDGWLDELVATFRQIPNAGLVGSKLVYPNGELQEAGGIVWEDASGANFGRGGDAQRPEYNYLRDVDYVSGAAIMVPRTVWRVVGGFSEEFAPAYYEDTDLAMKIREAGKRVIYQPLSTIVHYEGVSSGTDVTKGVKRYQEINRVQFRDKWRSRLRTHGTHADFSRRVVDRGPRGRVLIVDAETPTPDKDSGSVTAYYYMRLLTDLGYRVTFVPDNVLWCGRYSRDLQRLGVEVTFSPYAKSSREFVLRNAESFDLIMLSRAPIGGVLIDELRAAFPHKPIVFDTVDLHHLRVQRQHEIEGRPELLDEARRLKALELNAIRKADLTILVSDYEAAYLEGEIGPFSKLIIPLIYEEFSRDAGFEERRDVIFVGGYRHPPNVDAVKYLIDEIWPRFRRFGAGARLHIVGDHAPHEFARYACEDVVVAGFVPDLEAYMRTIRISVAPIRYGAGVKGKVGNSLRMGVPVVGTPIAVEGMGLAPDEHVLVAPDAESFSAQMWRLYNDAALWEALSRRGQAYVRQKFGMDAARTKLDFMCGSLIAACAAQPQAGLGR